MQIYVSGNVLRSGDGSVEHPFKTIQEAALIAQAGDTVLVAPGIYREWVKPVNSGTESDRIKYVSTSRGEAVITRESAPAIRRHTLCTNGSQRC